MIACVADVRAGSERHGGTVVLGSVRFNETKNDNKNIIWVINHTVENYVPLIKQLTVVYFDLMPIPLYILLAADFQFLLHVLHGPHESRYQTCSQHGPAAVVLLAEPPPN